MDEPLADRCARQCPVRPAVAYACHWQRLPWRGSGRLMAGDCALNPRSEPGRLARAALRSRDDPPRSGAAHSFRTKPLVSSRFTGLFRHRDGSAASSPERTRRKDYRGRRQKCQLTNFQGILSAAQRGAATLTAALRVQRCARWRGRRGARAERRNGLADRSAIIALTHCVSSSCLQPPSHSSLRRRRASAAKNCWTRSNTSCSAKASRA